MDKRTKRYALNRLVKALAYLDEHGWCQYATKDEKGRVCASGAIDLCVTPNTRYRMATLVQHALELDLPEAWLASRRPSLILFNDAPGRTKHQVRALFTRTIKRLEKELAA